jgi:hypothetical protein
MPSDDDKKRTNELDPVEISVEKVTAPLRLILASMNELACGSEDAGVPACEAVRAYETCEFRNARRCPRLSLVDRQTREAEEREQRLERLVARGIPKRTLRLLEERALLDTKAVQVARSFLADKEARILVLSACGGAARRSPRSGCSRGKGARGGSWTRRSSPGCLGTRQKSWTRWRRARSWRSTTWGSSTPTRRARSRARWRG